MKIFYKYLVYQTGFIPENLQPSLLKCPIPTTLNKLCGFYFIKKIINVYNCGGVGQVAKMHTPQNLIHQGLQTYAHPVSHLTQPIAIPNKLPSASCSFSLLSSNF